MRGPAPVVIGIALCCGSWLGAQTRDENEVRETVLELYAALSAGDAERFVQFMLPEGYTEFGSGGGQLYNIDEDYVRRVLGSDLKIDLQVRDLDVRVFEDAALVTGYRVGSTTRPGDVAESDTLCLSMVWVRQEGKWKLAHVHLSHANPGRDS